MRSHCSRGLGQTVRETERAAEGLGELDKWERGILKKNSIAVVGPSN